MYYLKLDREQETADDSNRGNPEILPTCQRDRLRVIAEDVASIEPAPSDAGVSARRLCGLCCALNDKQGAEGEELDEGGEHLDKRNIIVMYCFCLHDVLLFSCCYYNISLAKTRRQKEKGLVNPGFCADPKSDGKR